jgi:hypothetical protein
MQADTAMLHISTAVIRGNYALRIIITGDQTFRPTDRPTDRPLTTPMVIEHTGGGRIVFALLAARHWASRLSLWAIMML